MSDGLLAAESSLRIIIEAFLWSGVVFGSGVEFCVVPVDKFHVGGLKSAPFCVSNSAYGSLRFWVLLRRAWNVGRKFSASRGESVEKALSLEFFGIIRIISTDLRLRNCCQESMLFRTASVAEDLWE